MKITAFILVLFILALNVLPCEDFIRLSERSSYQTNLEIGSSQASTTDLCSPFCLCNCCTIPLIASASIAYAHQPLEISMPAYIKQIIGMAMKISFSIWQPPKS